MEHDVLASKMDKLAKEISGEKGKILAYIFKKGDRTYDQLLVRFGEGKLRESIEELERNGFIRSRKELLHPFRQEKVYSLSDKGLYYLTLLESLFEREDTFFEAFVLKLVGVET